MVSILRPSTQTFLGAVNRVLSDIGDTPVSSLNDINATSQLIQDYIKEELKTLGTQQSWTWLRQTVGLTQNPQESLDVFRVDQLRSIEKLSVREDDGSVRELTPSTETDVLSLSRRQSEEPFKGFIPFVASLAVTVGQTVVVVVPEDRERIYRVTVDGTLPLTAPTHVSGTVSGLQWLTYGVLSLEGIRWNWDTTGRIRMRPYPGPLFFSRFFVTGFRNISLPMVASDILDIPDDFEKSLYLAVSRRIAKNRLDDPDAAREFGKELMADQAIRERQDSQPVGVQFMKFSYGGRIFNS
jgi:hypothetical protein